MTSSWIAYFTQRVKALKDDLDAEGVGIYGKDREGKAAAFCHSSGGGLRKEPGALLIENIDADERRIGLHEVVFPIRFEGKQLGCLHCESKAKGFFSEDTLARLDAFAAQLAPIWQPRNEAAAFELDHEMEKLKAEHPKFDWVGIYRLEGDMLYLTAFRGAPTPHPVIPKGKGICGAAVTANATVNVPDVSADDRYLSCDLRTRSELVVPIRDAKGHPIGEVDIDSHSANVFGPREQALIEAMATRLSPRLLQLI